MRVVFVALLIALAGCAQGGPDTSESEEPAPVLEPVVRFLVLGDMGTGEQPQLDVAAAMKKVCDLEGCDFVIGTGDNIYEVGVVSEYDPQFELKFETPYQDFDIPFYMSLGNHDNMGVRSGHAGGDFQVNYSHRTDRVSDKWIMPDRWYTHEQQHVQFTALDTNILFYAQTENPELVPLLTKDPDGVAQAAHVQEQLATGNASWRILYGHHPMFANGEHGNASTYQMQWFRTNVCGAGNVDIYFSGHDHDLEWLHEKPDECGNTTFIVSGAGAKTRSIDREPNPYYFQKGSTLGFFWAEIAGDRFTGRFYDAEPKLLFERTYWRGQGVPEPVIV